MGKHRRANPNPDYFKTAGTTVDREQASRDRARLATSKRAARAKSRPRPEPAPDVARSTTPERMPPPQSSWLPIRGMEARLRHRLDEARKGAHRIAIEARDLRRVARRLGHELWRLARGGTKSLP